MNLKYAKIKIMCNNKYIVVEYNNMPHYTTWITYQNESFCETIETGELCWDYNNNKFTLNKQDISGNPNLELVETDNGKKILSINQSLLKEEEPLALVDQVFDFGTTTLNISNTNNLENTNLLSRPETTCSDTQWESIALTEITDRECTPLTVCNEDEYESSTPPYTMKDRECKPLTDCNMNDCQWRSGGCYLICGSKGAVRFPGVGETMAPFWDRILTVKDGEKWQITNIEINHEFDYNQFNPNLEWAIRRLEQIDEQYLLSYRGPPEPGIILKGINPSTDLGWLDGTVLPPGTYYVKLEDVYFGSVGWDTSSSMTIHFTRT